MFRHSGKREAAQTERLAVIDAATKTGRRVVALRAARVLIALVDGATWATRGRVP